MNNQSWEEVASLFFHKKQIERSMFSGSMSLPMKAVRFDQHRVEFYFSVNWRVYIKTTNKSSPMCDL